MSKTTYKSPTNSVAFVEGFAKTCFEAGANAKLSAELLRTAQLKDQMRNNPAFAQGVTRGLSKQAFFQNPPSTLTDRDQSQFVNSMRGNLSSSRQNLNQLNSSISNWKSQMSGKIDTSNPAVMHQMSTLQRQLKDAEAQKRKLLQGASGLYGQVDKRLGQNTNVISKLTRNSGEMRGIVDAGRESEGSIMHYLPKLPSFLNGGVQWTAGSKAQAAAPILEGNAGQYNQLSLFERLLKDL